MTSTVHLVLEDHQQDYYDFMEKFHDGGKSASRDSLSCKAMSGNYYCKGWYLKVTA